MAHMSTQNPELQRRLAQGPAKIALAIRHGQQAAAGSRRLSPTQAQILAVVPADGGRGLGLGGIADRLGVTDATGSRAVSTLEDKGLLAKRRAADDRRNIRVFLTAEGGQQARRVWSGRAADLSLRIRSSRQRREISRPRRACARCARHCRASR